MLLKDEVATTTKAGLDGRGFATARGTLSNGLAVHAPEQGAIDRLHPFGIGAMRRRN